MIFVLLPFGSVPSFSCPFACCRGGAGLDVHGEALFNLFISSLIEPSASALILDC